MIANIITAVFLSIASFLIFLKQDTRTGRASYLVLAAGFAFMAIDFVGAAKDLHYISGLSLLFAGFGWILADAYGCLEWTKRR